MSGDKKKFILLVAPCAMGGDYVSALSRAFGLPVEVFVLPLAKGEKSLRVKHGTYLKLAWRVFRGRRQSAIVVFQEQYTALYYSYFVALLGFGAKGPLGILTELNFMKPSARVGKSLFRFMMAPLVRGRAVTKILCYSPWQAENLACAFGVSGSGRFIYVRFGWGSPFPEASPVALADAGGYFFSGGRSNRDYATLMKAFGGQPWRLKIGCEPANVAGLEVPSNVEVFTGCYGNDFEKLIAGARAVVIPCWDPKALSGLLVFVQALRHGKPVVYAPNDFYAHIVDVTRDFFVEASELSLAGLVEAVKKIEKRSPEAERLASEARAYYKAELTIDCYMKRLAEAVGKMR